MSDPAATSDPAPRAGVARVAPRRREAPRVVRRRWARRGRPSLSITVNLAPMIDMSFLLLIFFLVTTTFERAEGLLASKFPRDTAAAGPALPISPIVVRLAQTGPGADDFSITVDRFAADGVAAGALPGVLRAIQQQPGFDSETPVVIVADDAVRWDHVVGCWNAALRAGCRRIAFGEP